MSSAAVTWSLFRLGAFGEPYLVWHDGPDYSAFDALWTSDPVFVEDALLDGLAQHDALAAKAVGRLPLSSDSRARFVGILCTQIGSQPVGYHLRVAEALHQLTGDESWSSEVLRVLLGAGLWSDRFDAAIALAAFRPTEDIIAALAACVQDPDYLVRYHASNTLLRYAGLPHDVATRDDVFSLIRSRATAAEWSRAALHLAEAAKSEIRR